MNEILTSQTHLPMHEHVWYDTVFELLRVDGDYIKYQHQWRHFGQLEHGQQQQHG